MTLFRLLAGIVAAGVFGMAGAPLAAVVTLDDFDAPRQSLSVDPDSPSASQTDNNGGAADAGILGGYRDITLQWINGAGESTARVDFVDNNFFSHNQEATVVSRTTLVWDGLGGAGLNADLRGLEGLRINLVSSDFGLQWLFTIDDGNSTHSASVDTVAVPPGPDSLFLPFAAFSDFGDLDLGTVHRISLLANNTNQADLDVSVDSIQIVGETPVPVPATVSLFGVGLIGIALALRRRPA